MSDKQYKILIVDDEEVNSNFLKEVLEDAGFATEMAKDGLEALDVLRRSFDIDIILLDRMMPNLDGMGFMEELNKKDEWSSIPVIMQTASGSTTDVIEGSATGVYYYLTKPFNDEMVLSVVRAAIDEIEKDKE